MTRITDMCGDPQAESSEWLFKSLFAGAGHIVAAPNSLHCALAVAQCIVIGLVCA